MDSEHEILDDCSDLKSLPACADADWAEGAVELSAEVLDDEQWDSAENGSK